MRLRPLERDPYWRLKPGEQLHRCDVRWLVGTGSGVLYAESPTSMYFRFHSRMRREEMQRTLYKRWIKSVKLPGGVLVVAVAALPEGTCEECDNGITKEGSHADCFEESN